MVSKLHANHIGSVWLCLWALIGPSASANAPDSAKDISSCQLSSQSAQYCGSLAQADPTPEADSGGALYSPFSTRLGESSDRHQYTTAQPLADKQAEEGEPGLITASVVAALAAASLANLVRLLLVL